MLLQTRLSGPPDAFAEVVHWVVRAIEGAGILTIVLGALIATAYFVQALLRRASFMKEYRVYRGNLGRAILLGLELLVAADIINTVAVEPTFRNVGVLGLIVVIRTFLSFSLEVEINGHWPWHDSRRRAEARPEHGI